MSDSVTGEILSAFSIICLIAWWNDWPPIADREVTTYHATCYSAQGCKSSDLILYRTVYRTDLQNFSVTSWGKEDGAGISVRHRCAIRDMKNWECAAESADSPWTAEGMHDGIVSDATQTSWYHWWWLRFLRIGEKK